MTQKQTEEIRTALEEFFKLPKSVNDITLKMFDRGIKRREYGKSVEALLTLGEWAADPSRKIYAYNHAEALRIFSETYGSTLDSNRPQTNAQSQIRPITYPVHMKIPEKIKLSPYEKNNELREEWRCISLCLQLARYKLLERDPGLQLSMFAGGSRWPIQNREKISKFIGPRNEINTSEAAQYIDSLLALEQHNTEC